MQPASRVITCGQIQLSIGCQFVLVGNLSEGLNVALRKGHHNTSPKNYHTEASLRSLPSIEFANAIYQVIAGGDGRSRLVRPSWA